MRTPNTLAFILLFCLCFWSARAEEIIQASDAAAIKAAMGKQTTVEGVIASARWSASGKVMNIRFKDTTESKFVAAIFEKDRKAFDDAFEGDAPRVLTGSKVRINGLIKEFRGNPEIVLKEPKQVTIVEKPKPVEDKKGDEKPKSDKGQI